MNWEKFKSDLEPRLNMKKLATSCNLSDKKKTTKQLLWQQPLYIIIDEFHYNSVPNDIMLHLQVRQIWSRNHSLQFGFRFKHYTQHALSYLDDIVSTRLNVKNKPTVACDLQ